MWKWLIWISNYLPYYFFLLVIISSCKIAVNHFFMHSITLNMYNKRFEEQKRITQKYLKKNYKMYLDEKKTANIYENDIKFEVERGDK